MIGIQKVSDIMKDKIFPLITLIASLALIILVLVGNNI